MNKSSIADLVKVISTRIPDPQLDYFAITLICRDDNIVEWGSFSEWAGYADKDKKIELRKASLVKTEGYIKYWREPGLGCVVINNVDEMNLFFLIGGLGLIEENVAKQTVPEFLKACPTVNIKDNGFTSVRDLPNTIFNRAPTPKIRMKVLKRDNHRCIICGRRATDHVDLELHVHHIRPWADGGLTDGNNLTTLCHTCHNGLDPHYDSHLYNLLRNSEQSNVEEFITNHKLGVLRYRQRMFEGLDECELDE